MKTKLPDDYRNRMLAANLALECFASGTMIFHCDKPSAGFWVQWTRYSGTELVHRRWMTRNQDFYPMWYRQWGHGGTCSTALANLIRWCQGKPVLPLTTWIYWAGQQVNLGDRKDYVEILRSAGYPETVPCVLCEREITGGMDWWSLKGVTGPCCSMRSGCRQKGKAARDAEESQLAAVKQLHATMMEGAA